MTNKKETIELLARAVIIRDRQVLLVRNRRQGNIYLPGGHIEWGEPARSALRREIIEELGRDLRVGRFLGCVEHAFGQGRKRTHEINLFFSVGARGLSSPLVSQEPKLQFFWQPLKNLGAVDLQPYVLQRLLPELVKSKRPFWGSSLE